MVQFHSRPLSKDIEYTIDRLKAALRQQSDGENEHGGTPDVMYCFDCDKILLDYWGQDERHWEHHSVYSDGYEHGGVQSAIETLEYINSSYNE